MIKIAKRCPYCAHKLVDGKCKNEKCVAYVPDEKEEETTSESK